MSRMKSERKKWIESVKSIGSIYRDVYNALEKKGKEHLMAKLMFEKGLKAGRKIKEKMEEKKPKEKKQLKKKIGREQELESLKEITKALIKLYETYNIKAKVKKQGKERIVLSIENCEWSKLEGWNARHCASIEQFERGLIEGINAKYTHKCPGRKSIGDKTCKVVVELK